MSDLDYEQAANDLRVWLEDNRKTKMESEDDLEFVIASVLANRRMANGFRSSIAWETAWDDTLSIVAHLDTLRPVLESWWANESN